MKKDMFSLVQSATQKAFNQVGKITGRSRDPDLEIYSSLQPQDFTELMKKYGEQDILDYINHMEFKRLNNKGG